MGTLATRIAIIGGFLGAGKTTLLTKLATDLNRSGKKVGIITNDQGEALVDTQYTRAVGLTVAEVLRGCFCCRFNDLVQSARWLAADQRPDLILAEPVGSCTDLLATVIYPLKAIYPEEFDIAPFTVLVDAGALLENGLPDRSTLNGYLRGHQIEEAEVVVLSKSDAVPPRQLTGLMSAVRTLNPHAEVIPCSSVTGEGLDLVREVVLSRQRTDRPVVDIDYDRYAQAEAELGWYNGTFRMELPARTDTYDIALKIMGYVSSQYGDGDIAHVKLLLTSEKNAIKMNLVQRSVNVDGVRESRYGEGATTLVLNARVVSPPERLAQTMREAVRVALDAPQIALSGVEDAAFSPSRPTPTHRLGGP